MITLRKVSISLKGNLNNLLKDFNFTLKKEDKVAIIGEEGNGKSTLLKLIYDSKLIESYCNFSGEIIKTGIKIGYLEQMLDSKWNNFTVNDFFLKENYDQEIDYSFYEKTGKIIPILVKVKLNPDIIYSNQLVKTLSGGEKIKIQLAKILSKDIDVLLLDEPTNDLDIQTLKWLENFIKETKVPIIFVSHDEVLLENTANKIIHLEQLKRKKESKYTIEKLSYKDYVEKRMKSFDYQTKVGKKQQFDHKNQMEKFRQVYQKVAYQQETITRSDPHGAALLKKKMKNLKSQEKRYMREKEEFVEIPDMEEAINIDFNNKNIYIPNNKKILELDLPKLKINKKVLSFNITLNIYGKEHIVIIGDNGIGKTTLLKQIYDILSKRKDLKVGYMPQQYEEKLDSQIKLVDYIKSGTDKESITKAMTYLGSMKFTEEEMQSSLSDLSGGQKAKSLILKFILNDCNVLILDEPTRNLSPLSTPVIRKILSDYPGVIISVSHDRKYIYEVSDKIYELTKDGLNIITNRAI